MAHGLLTILVGLLLAVPLAAQERPLFDAHIHYSHDAWAATSTTEAIARLRQAGVVAALVSSSSDEGTQRLYAAAPDLVRPALRPYQRRGQLTSWLRDPAILAHVEDRLKTHRYVALGEFHVSGADADLPVVRRMVELARQHGLVLHAHSDADAVERLFRQDPKARILWAHAGFEKPETVRALMRRQPHLWADLSFRYDVTRSGDIAPEWKTLLLEFSDRFMVGTDTYTPERWNEVGEHAAWARSWLDRLPPEAASRIARDNAETLFPPIGR